MERSNPPKDITEIVKSYIEKTEKIGTRAGGSGHMGNVDYHICRIFPAKLSKSNGTIGWKVTFMYTIIITTEFTIYPDNPPYENSYKTTIWLDNNGKIIKEDPKKMVHCTTTDVDKFAAEL